MMKYKITSHTPTITTTTTTDNNNNDNTVLSIKPKTGTEEGYEI